MDLDRFSQIDINRLLKTSEHFITKTTWVCNYSRIGEDFDAAAMKRSYYTARRQLVVELVGHLSVKRTTNYRVVTNVQPHTLYHQFVGCNTPKLSAFLFLDQRKTNQCCTTNKLVVVAQNTKSDILQPISRPISSQIQIGVCFICHHRTPSATIQLFIISASSSMQEQVMQ